MTQQQMNMRRAGYIILAVGIVFAITALPVLHPAARLFLALAYWPMHTVPVDLLVPAPLMLAIAGGLTAGLGAMLWALGTHVAGDAPEAAAKVATIATWTWFCTDSAFSVVVGAPVNVILNLSFLTLMLWSSRPRDARLPAAT